jgi:hypothetical protein
MGFMEQTPNPSQVGPREALRELGGGSLRGGHNCFDVLYVQDGEGLSINDAENIFQD